MIIVPSAATSSAASNGSVARAIVSRPSVVRSEIIVASASDSLDAARARRSLTRITDITRCSSRPSDVRVAAERGISVGLVVSSASASRTAPASRGLFSGSRSSIRATSSSSARGASARTDRTRGASSTSSFASTATACAPENAGLPVQHSNKMHPSENTSLRASTFGCPRACSGERNPMLPITAPTIVSGRLDCVRSRASPKSSTFARAASPPTRNTFPGFKSRCTIPCACATAIAPTMRDASAVHSSIDIAPRSSRCPKSSPSSHSIASHPRSCAMYFTIASCSSAASTSASRKNLSSCARSPSTFTATRSPLARSRASHTTPIPPAPASRTSSNRSPTTLIACEE
jgi:hypothetical protein